MNNIQVFPGAEGIKQVYREALKKGSLSIVCLSENYDQVIGDFFEKEFSPKVYGKIKTREVLPDTLGNRKSLASKDKSLNDVRFVIPTEPSESDLIIMEDAVALISFSSATPMGVLITEKELVKSFKTQFETLWSGSLK